MPNIEQTYIIPGIRLGELHQACLRAFKEMGISSVTEEGQNELSKKVHVRIPSIWGNGEMTISVWTQQQGNSASLEVSGYIAQMGVSPLTKKMDLFLEKLKHVLREDHGVVFTYQKLTKFIPTYKMQISKKDKRLFFEGTIESLFAWTTWSNAGEGIFRFPIILYASYGILVVAVSWTIYRYFRSYKK